MSCPSRGRQLYLDGIVTTASFSFLGQYFRYAQAMVCVGPWSWMLEYADLFLPRIAMLDRACRYIAAPARLEIVKRS